MNVHELSQAIHRNGRDDQQQVQLELLSLIQTLSTAILELAGTEKLKTDKDPLGYKSRLVLSEFLRIED